MRKAACRDARKDRSAVKPARLGHSNDTREEDLLNNRIFIAEERYYHHDFLPPEGIPARCAAKEMDGRRIRRGDTLYTVTKKIGYMDGNDYIQIEYVAEKVFYMADFVSDSEGKIIRTDYTAVPEAYVKKVYLIRE